MNRINFIVHSNVEILFLDLTNLKFQEILDLMNEVEKVITSKPLNSVLILSDVSNAEINPRLIPAFIKYFKNISSYRYASAIIGMPNIFSTLLNSVISSTGKRIWLFNNKLDALNWLATRPTS